jgi:hypothetical protein
MNAKKAKLLRKAASYKNQSATPGVMDFPGVSKAVHMPVFDTHEAVKTSYVRLPLDLEFTKVFTKVRRLTTDRHGKPVLVLNADGTPKTQLEVLSKPGVLRADEPKGVYRAMKKLIGRYGTTGFVATSELAATAGAPA